MSSLPQRKKTAEEIAQLRESLGVPTATAATAAPISQPPATAAVAPEPMLSPTSFRFEKLIHSKPAAATVIKLNKSVRSLRKSEQGPIEVRIPAAGSTDSKLPSHRHRPEEIEEMRRREALDRLNTPAPNPKLLPAHPLFIAPGYLLTLGAAACFLFDRYPLAVSAICAAGALINAGLLLALRPLSRHHSGFIAATTLLISAFGTLHYFPHLQHAP